MFGFRRRPEKQKTKSKDAPIIAQPSAFHIQFDNVHKNLGGRDILKGLNLGIRRGETFVIIGLSGTGKSVSLKHMIGLMDPDSGVVSIGGVDISLLPRAQRLENMKKFGYLFQSGALLNWMTIEQNVALPLKELTNLPDTEIARIVEEKLGLVNLIEHKHKFPSEISGGMKKRAGLARAIVREPEILLYDEPTSGLDPVMSRQIDRLIRKLQRELGITSIVVTHDMESAYNCADRIGMLYDGRILQIGTTEEIKRTTDPIVRAFVKGDPIPGTEAAEERAAAVRPPTGPQLSPREREARDTAVRRSIGDLRHSRLLPGQRAAE